MESIDALLRSQLRSVGNLLAGAAACSLEQLVRMIFDEPLLQRLPERVPEGSVLIRVFARGKLADHIEDTAR